MDRPGPRLSPGSSWNGRLDASAWVATTMVAVSAVAVKKVAAMRIKLFRRLRMSAAHRTGVAGDLAVAARDGPLCDPVRVVALDRGDGRGPDGDHDADVIVAGAAGVEPVSHDVTGLYPVETGASRP